MCVRPGHRSSDKQGQRSADEANAVVLHSPRRPSRATSSRATAWMACMLQPHTTPVLHSNDGAVVGRNTAVTSRGVVCAVAQPCPLQCFSCAPCQGKWPSTMQQQQLAPAPAPTSSSPFNSRPTRQDFFVLGQRHRGADCWHHAACHAERGQLDDHRLQMRSRYGRERGNGVSPRSAAAMAEIGRSRPWLRQQGFQAAITCCCCFCCAVCCTEAQNPAHQRVQHRRSTGGKETVACWPNTAPVTLHHCAGAAPTVAAPLLEFLPAALAGAARASLALFVRTRSPSVCVSHPWPRPSNTSADGAAALGHFALLLWAISMLHKGFHTTSVSIHAPHQPLLSCSDSYDTVGYAKPAPST